LSLRNQSIASQKIFGDVLRRTKTAALIFRTKDLIMIQDGPAVFDRSVQCAKLKTDLETSTAHAEQCGVPITTIIRNLLEMAEWGCSVANDRNVDLSALSGWDTQLGGDA
jgi:hypothetical protein